MTPPTLAQPPTVAGLVLAAGAGTRFGMPKALASTADGRAWAAIAAERLRDAGCDPVLVVLGAGVTSPDPPAELAQEHLPQGREGAVVQVRRGDPRELVPGWAHAVVAEDWAEGMGASLRAGLDAVASATLADAVLVTLVDLPSASPEAERRVLAAVDGTASLARAVDDGRPAHPVLIGRDHWAALAATLVGDAGARGYLRANGAVEVDITGLGGADDIDVPAT